VVIVLELLQEYEARFHVALPVEVLEVLPTDMFAHVVLVTNCAYGNSRSMNIPHTINTDMCVATNFGSKLLSPKLVGC